MDQLVAHAERELRRAGLFDKDSDYEGMIGACVLALVKTFAEENHSGGSAHITLQVFDIVARFKTLSPLTSDPSEWMEVGQDMWQNTRQSSCFSTDGGKTFYDIDDEARLVRTAVEP